MARPLRISSERGSATAEFAVALPALVLVLVLVLTVATAAITQVRCADAARAAARAVSVGESADVVARVVADLAGSAAVASIATDDGFVNVHLSCPVSAGRFAPDVLTATASVSMPLEPQS